MEIGDKKIMKYCRKCGTKLAEGDAFCTHCGAVVNPSKSQSTGKINVGRRSVKKLWWITGLLVIVVILALILFVRGNKGSSKISQNTSSTEISSSITSKTSTSSDKTSQTSSSSSSTTTAVDDKTVGVLVALLYSPDWFKEWVNQGEMTYGVASSDSGDLEGYSYITAGGTASSYMYYKLDGDTVTYKYYPSAVESITKTVSLAQLEKDYYVTQSQKDEVNGYVNKLKTE